MVTIAIGGCVFCPLRCHSSGNAPVKHLFSPLTTDKTHHKKNVSFSVWSHLSLLWEIMSGVSRYLGSPRSRALPLPGNTIRGKNDTDKVGRDYCGQLAAGSQNSEANIGNNFNSLYFVTLYATPITSFSLICFNIELKRMDFSHFRVRGTLSSLQWHLV